MLIDARGKGCPQPVLLAAEELGKIAEGIVEVLVDNEDAALNVSGYAAQNGLYAETVREGRDWKVKVVKGYMCRPGAAAGTSDAQQKRKSLLVVIGTDSLGKDEDLGRKLMQGFLDTMKVYQQLPHTLFFLNAGVRLTTTNDAAVAVLREIVLMGTEIYSCGTCLKHYDLEASLKVGKRGTTNTIVEGLQDFEKVVWI
jgi:selenium metabolism protein YedF